MGKVIAIGPGGRAQAPVRDDRCRPVIEAVVAHQLLDRLLLSPPCRTQAEAQDLRLALNRSARYFCSCGRMYCTRKYSNLPSEASPHGGCPHGGQRTSCRADVVLWTDPADGRQKYCVQFKVMDKRESMRWVVATYGPDPNQWPYFARRKQLKARA
jgi:hypothetical protein